MDALGRKGREINREERESRERDFNNQHIREREMKGKGVEISERRDGGLPTQSPHCRIERREAVPDGLMAVVGLMLMLSTITDRMHLERPTEYALTFDRSGLRRRKRTMLRQERALHLPLSTQ